MKKLLVMFVAALMAAVFAGCVSTNDQGQLVAKGVISGKDYTKENIKDAYKHAKEIYRDGKHIVLEVKEVRKNGLGGDATTDSTTADSL